MEYFMAKQMAGPVYFKPTEKQDEYLTRIMEQTGQSKSEVIRGCVQAQMDKKSEKAERDLTRDFVIKSHYILREFVKQSSIKPDQVLDLAKLISDELIESCQRS